MAELATDVTEPPVRLVKTIGDAAMFVSPDAGALVSVALSLLEAVEAAELPSLRAGVASGTALQRAGDYYGHAVNLASRVTGVARAGSVLCTEEVRDQAPRSVRLVVRAQAHAEGHVRPDPAVPRPTRTR